MTKETLKRAQFIQSEMKSILLDLDILSKATAVKVQVNTYCDSKIIDTTTEINNHILEYLSYKFKQRLAELETEFNEL